MMKTVFQVRGMDCAEEISTLRSELQPLPGIQDLSFDLLSGTMTVTHGPELSPAAITSAIARTGMGAEEVGGRAAPPGPAGFWELHQQTILTVVSGALGLTAFLTHVALQGLEAAVGSEGLGEGHAVPAAAVALYALSVVAGVWRILPKAWYAARRLRPDMNLLMTIAVLGAIAIGEWFEAATVSFLFALSLLLESWSVARARRAVAALLDLSPPTARVREPDGREREVPVDQVAVGRRVVVWPGERIPVDGNVTSGGSHVNQAPITGESLPVAKQPGDAVFAGTINGDGTLEIECLKIVADTTLSRIIRMVGEAQSRRSPSEQWVERFARVYTPVVMALAVLVLIALPTVFSQSWEKAVYNSLVLLVIACPCALVISTPVTIVAALAAAARHGVLIKGGMYVEMPASLRSIAFDKTGTLTEGRLAVTEIVALNGHTEQELLERAAAMETRSTHPLAKAILAYAAERKIHPEPVDEFQIVPGKGATARFQGRSFWIGSHRYLEDRQQETPEVHEQLTAMASRGQTIIVVGNEEHVCGMIALADQIRPDAQKTLDRLHKAGVRPLVMLTGDNAPTAKAIGEQVGVDEIRAELLPEDKVKVIEELVAAHHRVAMIGDGVNDAPALARSSLGIAMGAIGSDAAIETADVALMSDDLTRIPWLIDHSRQAIRVIHQNIAFSLAVKVVFVLLTLTGIASLWIAIAADIGASLLVIFNGLRLLGTRPPEAPVVTQI